MLVAAIQLLTFPGTWIVTDLAEALFTARRLLDHGTLVLSQADEGGVPDLRWLHKRPGKPLKSRLLPGTALSLLPLLALDRALGTERPGDYGLLVHLQGHALVLASLAVLGLAVREAGGSPRAAAAAVTLTGLSWPLWNISRRSGPESLILLCVALALLARVREEQGGPTARTQWLLGVAMAAIVWTNPTGAVFGAVLLATSAAEVVLGGPRGDRERPLWALRLPSLAFLASLAALVLFWNRLYQGHWWAGGYGSEGSAYRFLERDALSGLLLFARDTATAASPLLIAAAAGLVYARRPLQHGIALPLALFVAIAGLMSTFYSPEPVRRLAAAWPAVGLLAGRTWDAVPWRSPAPQALVAAAGLQGFYWFMANDGNYYPGPAGLFYPAVHWVKLAIDLGFSWCWAGPVLLLVGVAAAAAARVSARLGG